MGIWLVILLSAITFVSLKGNRMLMTLFALELGAGPFETGMLFAVYGLAPCLFVISAGRLADRFGNRGLLYAGLTGFAGALTLPAFFPTLPFLFIASPLIGLTSMIFILALQNLVGVLSMPESRTRNYSYYSLSDSGGAVVGPVLVGFLIDGYGHQATYYVLAVIAAACLVLFHVCRSAVPSRTGPAAANPGPSVDLLRLPALRNALITNGIVMAGIDLYLVYFPVYTRAIGLSASEIGVIVGAYGVAGFLVRALIPPVTARWGVHAMIAGALVIACVSFIAIPLTHSVWLLGAVSFMVGLGMGCGQPLSLLLSFNAAPPGRSAEAVGMRMAVSYGTHVVIPPLFGTLGAAVGLAPVFWICAVLMGGGAALNRKGAARGNEAAGSGKEAG